MNILKSSYYLSEEEPCIGLSEETRVLNEIKEFTSQGNFLNNDTNHIIGCII
jgi:hypothetical protein